VPADLADIETRADCERLVRAFYSKAMADPVIGFLFTDVAHLDLEAHVPQITSFWETILLGTKTYSGNPFAKHVPLHQKAGLREGHFKVWLGLWFGTVDELFAGDRANQAKVHALRVAQAFSQRLESFPAPRDAAAPGGLAVTTHGPERA
jgi:hemoglobin